MNFLSVDIGTTCCKCQLFDENGEILYYGVREYGLRREGEDAYVDVDGIRRTLAALIRESTAFGTAASLAISCLGESFVLLDGEDNILFYPMLYTDPRGLSQAEALLTRFGGERLYRTTGVLPQPMYSIAKLLYIKENYPALYGKADKLLLVGEYFGYLLTGKRVIDYGLAARTGIFNVREKCFATDLLAELGVDSALFSTPARTGSIVSRVTPSAAAEFGLSPDCVLVLGSHDQICATLGAGVLRAGEAADGMGTVECMTALFDTPVDDLSFGEMGYPIVPYAVDGLYCTYFLSYSCGSLVNWFRRDILHGYAGGEESFFTYMEKKLPARPSEILTLPYFGGAANPYQDPLAKGAMLGLTLQSTDAEIYRSILEATAYEMRLNMEMGEQFGVSVKRAVATGGGANSRAWLQIKSDITGIPLRTLRSSEGGLCGCAMLQAVAMGAARDLDEAKTRFVRYAEETAPRADDRATYDKQYDKYKKLYKTVKELY